MLKTAEGVFKFVTGQIRHGYEHGSLKEKLGALMSQSMFERMRKKLDPREFGAAPLLGLAKPAFIAHGSSDAYSIRRGIGAVRSYAKADLVKHMTAAIAQAAPLLRAEEAGVSELPSTSVALMGSGASAVELPTKLTVTRAPGVFEVSWKWREQVSRATFFAPLMTSLSAIGGLTNVAVHAPIVAGVAALGLLGIVGGFSAAYAKNTMRVRVTQGALVLTSGPIGGRTVEIAADDVVDVVAAQRQVRARRPALWSVTLLMKSAPGEKPKKPRPIVGFMMQQAQAEEIARLVRDALFRA
jgi:hypothetical protein